MKDHIFNPLMFVFAFTLGISMTCAIFYEPVHRRDCANFEKIVVISFQDMVIQEQSKHMEKHGYIPTREAMQKFCIEEIMKRNKRKRFRNADG